MICGWTAVSRHAPSFSTGMVTIVKIARPIALNALVFTSMSVSLVHQDMYSTRATLVSGIVSTASIQRSMERLVAIAMLIAKLALLVREFLA